MTARFPEQLLLDSADIAAVAPPLADIVEMVEHTYRMDGRGRGRGAGEGGRASRSSAQLPARHAGLGRRGKGARDEVDLLLPRQYRARVSRLLRADRPQRSRTRAARGDHGRHVDHLRADGGLRRGRRQALRAPRPGASRPGRVRRPRNVVSQGAVGPVPHPRGRLRRIAHAGEPREILRRHGGGGELDPDPGGHPPRMRFAAWTSSSRRYRKDRNGRSRPAGGRPACWPYRSMC